MIELVDGERCTACNICVTVCPTNVFDRSEGVPVIARQDDCQTCFLCELYCPDDALFVTAYAERPQGIDVASLRRTGLLGSYRRAVGWTDETRHLREADRSFLLFGKS